MLGNKLAITQEQNTVQKDFIHRGKFVNIKYNPGPTEFSRIKDAWL